MKKKKTPSIPTEIVWTTQTRKLSELKDYEHNPRRLSGEAFEKLVESLKQDGYHGRISINTDNTIIGGHQRRRAMLEVGYDQDTEIEILVPNRYLDETELDRINIRDNLPYGDFDWDILANRFEPDYLVEIGMPEHWIPVFEQLEPGLTDQDELPQVDKADVKTKPGDLYILGNHRLLCGDSTDALHVERLLDGQSPNTMITDPPYGVEYEADWRSKRIRNKKTKKSARDENNDVMNDDKADWYDAYVLFPGAVAYVWHAASFTDIVMDGLKRAGFLVKQQIIWNKNHFAIGRSDYHWKHEPAWYAVKEGQDRNWKGGRSQSTVWDVTAVNYDSESDKTAHPTQKPVELYIKSLEHHTNGGEYVYDPFAGSGTLGIACEKLGRRALMMELDPRYCDIIVQRWEMFTGKRAKRVKG
jgi:DNA modification methylase